MTAGSLFAARVVTAAAQLAMVPLLLTHLGVELFGVWVALCTLPIILQVADFGLGNAMVNDVARISHAGNKDVLLNYTAKRYSLLFLISVTVAITGFTLSFSPIWRGFFNVPIQVSDTDLYFSLIAVVLISASQIILNATQQMWLGMQKGMLNGVFIGVGASLNFLAIVWCVEIDAGLPWIVLSSSIGMVFSQLFSTIFLFSKIEFRIKYFLGERLLLQSVIEILKNSRGYFVIQLCGLASFNLDVLLVSRFIGGEGVAEYSVVARLFSIPTLALSLFLVGLWPVVSRAKVTGDFAWIRRSFARSLAGSLILSAIASMVLYFTSDIIISLWTKGVIHPSNSIVLGFSIWTVITAVGGNIATYLNGIGEVSYQARMSVFFSLINIISSLVLVNIIGTSGPIWGSIFSSSIYYIFAVRHVKKAIR